MCDVLKGLPSINKTYYYYYYYYSMLKGLIRLQNELVITLFDISPGGGDSLCKVLITEVKKNEHNASPCEE